MAVQRDGRIVTAGEAQRGGRNILVSSRMNSDGRLDPSYGNGGWVVLDIGGGSCGNAIALQTDGKIVIAGTGTGSGGLDFAAVRLLPDGTPDPSFGNRGVALAHVGASSIANAVSIQPADGKIVLGGVASIAVAGQKAHNEFAVARLNPDGTRDTGFGSGGATTLAPPAAAWAMALQPDGRIVLAGEQDVNGTQAYMAARVLPDGAPDSTFGNSGVVTIRIGSKAFGDAVAVQGNGRIVLAGSAYTTSVVAAAVRLLPDGSVDPSFGAGGIATVPDADAVNGIALDPGGRIVLAGVGATAVRLLGDGSPDQSFAPGGRFLAQLGSSADAANGVAIEPASGAIVLAGCAHAGGALVLSVIRIRG